MCLVDQQNYNMNSKSGSTGSSSSLMLMEDFSEDLKDMNPLESAARHGDLDSFKTLIRDGADIEQHGRKCLKKACLNDHDNIVSYLIQSGVDMNYKTEDGFCALDLCFHPKRCRCLKLLVDSGAVLDARCHDSVKLSLLNYCDFGIVYVYMAEYLLRSPSFTRAEKIEALEYMGAKCVNYVDFRSAYRYWLMSLEERGKAESCDLVQPKSQLTHPAYGNRFHTAEDLYRIALSKEDMWMQAFVTIEDITGYQYPFYDEPGVCEVLSYLETVSYQKCISIAMYRLERLLQSSGVSDILLESLLTNLKRVIFLLWSKDPPEPYEVVLPMLFKGVCMTELIMQAHKDDCLSRFQYGIGYQVYQFVFCAMGFLAERQTEMLDKDRFDFHQMISDFVNLDPCVKSNRVLHILFHYVHPFDMSPFPIEFAEMLLGTVIDPTVTDSYHETQLHSPCKQHKPPYIIIEVIKLLLEAGVDPQAVDGDGNTPMHLVAMNSHHPSKYDVTKLLLSKCCSCALDMCNKEGNWFTDYLPFEMAREIENSCDVRSLQCLSANTVLTYSIPYETVLPTRLSEFVKTHPSIKAGRILLLTPVVLPELDDF